MPKTKFEYHEVAQIQLDEAINFYNSQNYICATTLAGAASELLNNLVEDYSDSENYRQKAINTIQKNYPDFNTEQINTGRNMLKHLNEKYFEKTVNLKNYASAYILMGIGDYFTLREKTTVAMSQFWKEYSNEILNLNIESTIDAEKN